MVKKNNPMITVIVPSYNHEAYIVECIEGIINQTFKDYNLIVIDDGSTDNSPALIRDLASKYGFVHEIQSNMGLSATLNKAIRKYAAGDYVAICASDDIWMPDKLEKQIAYIQQNQLENVAVYSGYSILIDESSRIISKRISIKPHIYGFQDFFYGKAKVNAQTALIKLKILKEVGLYDENIGFEDIYMWLKLTSKGYKIAVMPEYLAYYRVHPHNTMKRDYLYNISTQERILSDFSYLADYDKIMRSFYFARFCEYSKIDKQLALTMLKKSKLRGNILKLLKGLFWLIFFKKSTVKKIVSFYKK